MPVEGPWLDRVNGLESVQVDIVMMRTLDGHGRLELTKFCNPKLVEIEPAIAPPNTRASSSRWPSNSFEGKGSVKSPGFNPVSTPISANLIKATARRMYFVP
jgi:hypothetical protein